jgi:hypothetical protein
MYAYVPSYTAVEFMTTFLRFDVILDSSFFEKNMIHVE